METLRSHVCLWRVYPLTITPPAHSASCQSSKICLTLSKPPCASLHQWVRTDFPLHPWPLTLNWDFLIKDCKTKRLKRNLANNRDFQPRTPCRQRILHLMGLYLIALCNAGRGLAPCFSAGEGSFSLSQMTHFIKSTFLRAFTCWEVNFPPSHLSTDLT